MVNAPELASIDKICSIVAKRAPWILKNQEAFANYPLPLPAHQYVSGESFRYLGRQYRLKVSKGKMNKAKLKGQFLIILVHDPFQKQQIKNLVEGWLRDKAHNIFSSLLMDCLNRVQAIGIVSAPPLRIRRMKRRWGSCSPKGIISLNPDLVSAPKDCIEYVITHELCHLVEMNHSKRFYALLDSLLPDWKIRKALLNRTVELRLWY